MAVDIVIQETIDSVDITVNPNIIEVNVTRTSGGGAGSQTLAQTLDLGNSTGGENILVNNADAIELQNGSLLKKGTYDFDGAGGGISRICSVGYEDMWQSGIRYVYDNNGLIRNASNGFDAIPDENFDVTLRFKVGSFWTLDDGTTYVCTDATDGAAVWDLYATNVPTLQQVLDNNHDLVDENNFQGTDAGLNNTGTFVIAFGQETAKQNTGTLVNAIGSGAAAFNEGNDINALGTTALLGNQGNDVNALGFQAGTYNTFNNVNLFGENAQADEDGQTVLSKDGTIMARISTTELTENRKYTLQDADGTIAFLSDISSGAVDSVNGQTGVVVLDADDIDDTSTTNKFTTASDISKLAGIEANADVTDSTNVNAAGAVMNSDYSSHSILVQQSGSGSPTSLGIANNTLVGRLSGGGSNINDLSVSDVKGLLDFTTPTDVQTIADAKVTDAIVDGVTTVAPSQNAVFDLFQFTRRLITNGTGSVTGTTAETILTSLTIPANTLDSKCFIWSTMDYFKSSSSNCTLRLYINTSNSLSGATLIGFASVGSNRNVSFNRKLYLNGTTLDFLTSNTGTSQISSEFVESIFSASTTLTVNPAANIFLIYTTQNDAVGTTATSKQATVQKMKLN
jgi:hypothetical protein